jgi:archaellum component FlaC
LQKADIAQLEQVGIDIRSEVKGEVGRLDGALESLDRKFTESLDRVAALEQAIKDQASAADLASLVKRLKSVEELSSSTTKRLDDTRDSLQHVVSAFGSIHHTRASLDPGLPLAMRATAEHVVNNFDVIFDSITNLKADVGTLHKLVRTKEGCDFSQIELRPPSDANWQDVPELPPLTKFNSVENIVTYIYEMVPQLQGYLTAMHAKILEPEIAVSTENPEIDAVKAEIGEIKVEIDGVKTEIDGVKTETGEVKTEITEVTTDIVDVKTALAELRAQFAQIPTKSDLTAAIKKIKGMQSDPLTSIGSVRCMACGREMQGVSGALTPEEAEKLLGSPSNFVVAGPSAAGPYSPIYSGNSMDAFDSAGILESPRSTRTFRSSTSARRRIYLPVSPK